MSIRWLVGTLRMITIILTANVVVGALFGQSGDIISWKLAKKTEDSAFSVEEQFTFLDEAMRVCQTQTCHDTTLAYNYQRKAVLLGVKIRDYSLALTVNDSAVILYRKSLGLSHPRTINALFNNGFFYYRNRQYEKAISIIDSAITLTGVTAFPQMYNVDSAALNYNYYRTLSYLDQGQYEKAIFYGKQGLINIAVAPSRQRVYLNAVGRAYLQLDKPKQALYYFQEALKALPTQKISRLRVTHLINVGLAYFGMEQDHLAIEHLQTALNYLTQAPTSTRNNLTLATQWYNMGIIRIRAQDITLAKQALDSSQYYTIRLPIPHRLEREQKLLHLKSRIALEKGDYENVLKNIDTLLQIIGPNLKISDGVYNGISSSREMIANLHLKAIALTHLGQWKDALAIVDFVNKLGSLNRRSAQSPLSKLFINQRMTATNEQAIAICQTQWQRTNKNVWLDRAYNYATLNKAILLLESLQAEEALQYSGLPENLTNQEQALTDSIYAHQQRLANPSLAVQARHKLEVSLDSIRQVYQQLQSLLESNYPKYYNLKYSYAQPLTTEEVSTGLDEGQALIDFFVGADSLYLFAISKEGGDIYSEVIPQGFTDSLQLYQELISNGIESDCETRFISLSRYFYQLLLATPLGAFPPDVNRLIFVPDGLLNHLAFETLLYKDITNLSGSNGCLLERYACSYLYSSRLLSDEQVQSATPARFFLGLGLEYDEHTLQYLEQIQFGKSKFEQGTLLPCQTPLDTSRQFGKLIYSDDEVEAIQNITAGTALLNNQVVKERFLELAPDYKILHLAMHGSYDTEFPLNSALIFSRTQSSNDIFLRAAEIYGLQLNGEMAVLSACNTANGKLEPGEGVISLARAFHYAGIPSVVASLWSIPDNSSSSIMQLFYRHLKEGQPKDIALQKAKLEYLRSDEWSSPYTRMPVYWGAAVVIGDVSIVDLSESVGSWWWILLVLPFGWWIFNRRKNKKSQTDN